MASHTSEDPKPDGAAFDTFFDSIGKKAEGLSINDENVKSDPATNGTELTEKPVEEEPKIVDEIESLCMNCQANVCSPLPRPIHLLTLLGNYSTNAHPHPLLPRNNHHVILLPTL